MTWQDQFLAAPHGGQNSDQKHDQKYDKIGNKIPDSRIVDVLQRRESLPGSSHVENQEQRTLIK
jgi:hypothetical protein